MRYKFLELTGYLPFRGVSKIKKLTVRFTSPVQLILGTNGSGKTRFLKECNPLPAKSSDFEPDGRKELILDHEGSEYIIISDFSKKGGAHEFYKDGVSLNQGGTSGVQEDLVRRYLGYSKEIESIITMGEQVCSMGPASRKALLMTVSPCSMEYALEMHKKVISRIRAVKNTMSHLQERKIAIAAEMIDPSLAEQLQTESLEKNKQIADVIGWTHRINEILRQLREKSVGQYDTATEIIRSQDLLRDVTRVLARSHDVPRIGLESHRESLIAIRGAADAELQSLTTQLSEHAHDINIYTEKLSSLKSDDLLRQTEQDIVRARAEMDRISGLIVSDPFRESILEELPGLLEKIQDLVTKFIDIGGPILSPAVVTRKQQQYDRWRNTAKLLDREAAQLEDVIKRLAARLPVRMEDIPEAPCARLQCPLFVRFKNIHDATNDELIPSQERLRVIRRRLVRIYRFLEDADRRLLQSQYYLPHLYELSRIFTEYSYLRPSLQGIEIMQCLRSNPIVIYERLRVHYESSVSTYRLRDLETEIAEKLTALEVATNSEERKLLEELLARATERHQTGLERLRTVRQAIGRCEHELLQIEAYTAAKQSLNDQLSILQRCLDDETVKTEIVALTTIRSALEDFKETSVRRIGAIDHILREQQKLESRLNEEAIKQIEKLEVELSQLVLIEEALAGIPQRYMSDFVNAIIATMNHYIRQVFSYTYEIIPVDPDASLDYRFAMRVGEDVYKDIGMGSDAQQEITNLVFMLALIRQIGLSNYPIFLDEIGRSFDLHHKHQLLSLLRTVVDGDLVSQMFVINHHAEVHEGLANAEVLVLNQSNILVPPVFNQHADIEQ